MLSRVVWYKFTGVSEMLTASMNTRLHDATSHKTVIFTLAAETT
jgi:hypothetical protein